MHHHIIITSYINIIIHHHQKMDALAMPVLPIAPTARQRRQQFWRRPATHSRTIIHWEMASIAAKTPPSPSKKMVRGEIDDLMDLHRNHLDELKTRLADLKLEARDVTPPYDDIFLLRYLLSNAKDPSASKGMDKAEAVRCTNPSKRSATPRLTFMPSLSSNSNLGHPTYHRMERRKPAHSYRHRQWKGRALWKGMAFVHGHFSHVPAQQRACKFCDCQP